MEELDRATPLGDLGRRTVLVAELDGGRAFCVVEQGTSAAKVTAHLDNGRKRALEDLALYYLPTGAQARKVITGSTPLALPGRKP